MSDIIEITKELALKVLSNSQVKEALEIYRDEHRADFPRLYAKKFDLRDMGVVAEHALMVLEKGEGQ